MRLKTWFRLNVAATSVLLFFRATLVIEAVQYRRFFNRPFRFVSRRLDSTGRRQNHHPASSSGNAWGVKLLFRGGSNSDEPPVEDEESLSPDTSVIDETKIPSKDGTGSLSFQQQQSSVKGTQHASDVLQSLVNSRSEENEESLELRQLIATRANEYLDNLHSASSQLDKKLPHPKKLLHFLAPKIPAIRLSPDVNLRIQTARSDVDSGVAAALVGTLAQVCEWFDKQSLVQKKMKFSSKQKQQKRQQKQRDNMDDPFTSIALDIVEDRRFEQVVECLLCGVDVKKRKREYRSQKQQQLDSSENNSAQTPSSDIEEIMEEEDVQVDEGLDVRDSCRAAWGIAVLGVHHRLETIGGQKIMDLLIALSLRTRELLLARLQRIQQEDLHQEATNDNTQTQQTTEERLDELSEELAEDVSLAMWTFACVSACTGMRSASLFEACSSILCQDPVDMRRRAQDAEVALKNLNNIGTSDVVDRLARSEAEMAAAATKNVPESESESSSSSRGEKDALLDWLSPNELTDVLWALAVHGNTDKKLSKDEIVLSVNANALKEIAFDRLVIWLREDFKVLSGNSREGNDSTKEVMVEEELMTVEVVDAATLLASEKAAQNDVVDSAEKITVRDVSKDGVVEQLEVVDAVDAERILTSTPDLVETEVITTTTVVVDEQVEQEEEPEESALQVDNAGEEFTSQKRNVEQVNDPSSVVMEQQPIDNTATMHFSPHDLCSIAWAVTDLGDSLRPLIVELVINIFLRLGKDGLSNLAGADLSNLAWSIAKYSGEEQTKWSSDALDSSSLLVTLWVAESALRISWGEESRELEFTSLRIFESFQPPELSKLMWAVARVVSAHADLPSSQKELVRSSSVTFEHLSLVALVGAACNLSMFGTEDLVRISWAFFETCDASRSLEDPVVVSALGRILATIESSLLKWERGGSSSNSKGAEDDEENVDLMKELTLFSTFFGRTRGLQQALLNEIIEKYEDFEDDDNHRVTTATRTTAMPTKGRLPLLRDLSVDPASLCKAACGFARLTATHPHLKGSSTLTRIAVRLLTSKKGRLLRECTLFDLVRVCEAAAIHETLGRGEDLVVGQFTRHMVCLLNTALNSPEDGGQDNNGNSSMNCPNGAESFLSKASPSLIATLIWSLGELGARHSSAEVVDEADRLVAHRRLRLVSQNSLLTPEQVDFLSNASALRVLRGLVSMKVVVSDKMLLIEVLRHIESNIETFHNEDDLCELAETLCKLKQDIDDEDHKMVPPSEGPTEIISDPGLPPKDVNSTSTVADQTLGEEEDDLQGFNNDEGKDKEGEDDLKGLNDQSTLEGMTDNEGESLLESSEDVNEEYPTQESLADGDATTNTAEESPEVELLQLTERLLQSVATQSYGSIATWTAQGLRRLLVVLSSLPFRADELVHAIDDQVSRRRAILESSTTSGSSYYFQHHLRQAASDARSINDALFNKNNPDESSGMATTLRNGLKAIFGSQKNNNNNNNDDDEDTEDEEEQKNEAEEVEHLLTRAIESVTSLSNRIEDIAFVSSESPDKALQRIAQGTYFELGRCSELIATYHRIEFSTGKRRSRHNEKLTRDIAKRVLSRLLP